MDLKFFKNQTLISMVNDLIEVYDNHTLNEFQTIEIEELIAQIDLELDRRQADRVIESR